MYADIASSLFQILSRMDKGEGSFGELDGWEGVGVLGEVLNGSPVHDALSIAVARVFFSRIIEADDPVMLLLRV